MEKMVNYREILNFYKEKVVLITGHTGFKGTWLSKILVEAGAYVNGYALEPSQEPSLFKLSGIESKMKSFIGDICDYENLQNVFDKVQPEIVIHLAAQPIVLKGYEEPRNTYLTNVIGTVNVLECCRTVKSVKSILNVTTDKVYQNREWIWGYREDEVLNGYDPYSNSKSCSELVTECYINSFLKRKNIPVSTARAGNVIGGGDFSENRIIPDCIDSAIKVKPIIVRNPYSIRPYQHVLEPLFAYIMIAKTQYEDASIAGNYNVGPDESDCVTTSKLVEIFCSEWKGGAMWQVKSDEFAHHESNFLKLDCSKLKHVFGWKPTWNIDEAIQKTCEWTYSWDNGEDIEYAMEKQINAYILSAENL